jgi:hypothetical protein
VAVKGERGLRLEHTEDMDRCLDLSCGRRWFVEMCVNLPEFLAGLFHPWITSVTVGKGEKTGAYRSWQPRDVPTSNGDRKLSDFWKLEWFFPMNGSDGSFSPRMGTTT